jgi:hypothetical protein
MPIRRPSWLLEQTLQTIRSGRVGAGIIPEGTQRYTKGRHLGYGYSHAWGWVPDRESWPDYPCDQDKCANRYDKD